MEQPERTSSPATIPKRTSRWKMFQELSWILRRRRVEGELGFGRATPGLAGGTPPPPPRQVCFRDAARTPLRFRSEVDAAEPQSPPYSPTTTPRDSPGEGISG